MKNFIELLKKKLGIDVLEVDVIRFNADLRHDVQKLNRDFNMLRRELWEMENPPEFKEGDIVYLRKGRGFIKAKILHHISLLEVSGYMYRIQQDPLSGEDKCCVYNIERCQLYSHEEAKKIIEQLKSK